MNDRTFQLDTINPLSEHARSVGLVRQAIAADLVTRGDGWERGVRCVQLHNDCIALEVVIDRAFDIGSASIHQIPIGWRSPTEIVAPWFVENTGFGPHRGFFGGLLTTCGLDHIGAPVERSAERFNHKARTSDLLPMHGRFSGSPGTLTSYGVKETAEGVEAFVEGTVTQVAVFGEHLTLKRRISITYGSAVIKVDDEVTNHGYAASPLAVMYHVNFGWPVVAPCARLCVAGRVIRGEGDGSIISPPTREAAERTWLYAVEADADGQGYAGITNSHVSEQWAAGAQIGWDASSLPTLVEWQMSKVAGHYVVALEPSTITSLAANGDAMFPTLEPGESRCLGLAIELLHGPAGEPLLSPVEGRERTKAAV